MHIPGVGHKVDPDQLRAIDHRKRLAVRAIAELVGGLQRDRIGVDVGFVNRCCGRPRFKTYLFDARSLAVDANPLDRSPIKADPAVIGSDDKSACNAKPAGGTAYKS